MNHMVKISVLCQINSGEVSSGISNMNQVHSSGIPHEEFPCPTKSTLVDHICGMYEVFFLLKGHPSFNRDKNRSYLILV